MSNFAARLQDAALVLLVVSALVTDARAGSQADLSVTINEVTPGPYVPGRVVEYTVIVTNNGPDVAEAVEIDNTPENLFISGAGTDDPFDFCFVLPCDLGVLAVGETTEVSMEAIIPASGLFSDRFTAAASTPDPDESNNFDTTVVVGEATYAGTIQPGSIAVVSKLTSAIHRADPFRGLIEVISGGVAGRPQFGTGVALRSMFDILVLPSGLILVSSGEPDAIIGIDPGTRDRFILSGPGVGNGPPFTAITEMVRHPLTGEIIVTDPIADMILAVDLSTGDRTVISDNISVGTGPMLRRSQHIALLDSSTLAAAQQPVTGEFLLDAVYLVDLATGDREVYSGETETGTVGGGPPFRATGFDVLHGEVVYLDSTEAAVIRIDRGSRDRIIISGPGVGEGPSLQDGHAMAVTGGGDILVAASGVIYCVNGDSGDRFVITTANGYAVSPVFTSNEIAVPDGPTEYLFATNFEDRPPLICRL